MEWNTAMEYYSAITVIEAQNVLIDFNVSDYPHMKKDQRRKMHKKYSKMAYPKTLQEQVSFEDFIKRMTDGRQN